MPLAFADLEYRVRNVATQNVVAAFPNSSDAHAYISFLASRPQTSRLVYAVETTNIHDCWHHYVPDDFTAAAF